MFGAAALLTSFAPRAAADCTAADTDRAVQRALQEFVGNAYPEGASFVVLRNGKEVGQHHTRFAASADGLAVNSHMDLTVRVLLVPVYRFSYDASADWCGGRLVALDASTSRGGDVSRTRARMDNDALVVESDRGRRTATPDTVPTNHWNPRVLERGEVLNTITGEINTINIRPCAAPSPRVQAAAGNARCYEFSGDLETRVWYDDQQRWVGLQFAGDDGSNIEYVCRHCAP